LAKPTLGRGLGELLGSNRTGAEPSSPARAPGVGLRILIDGVPQPSASATQPGEPVRPSVIPAPEQMHESVATHLAQMMAIVTLATADVALLGWPLFYVATQDGPLSARAGLLCSGSIVLGAACGCAAVLMRSTCARKEQVPGTELK
jgi:hypothetical protein